MLSYNFSLPGFCPDCGKPLFVDNAILIDENTPAMLNDDGIIIEMDTQQEFESDDDPNITCAQCESTLFADAMEIA